MVCKILFHTLNDIINDYQLRIRKMILENLEHTGSLYFTSKEPLIVHSILPMFLLHALAGGDQAQDVAYILRHTRDCTDTLHILGLLGVKKQGRKPSKRGEESV